MYAIVRSDIEMGPGKAASQAGHAYVGAFLHSLTFGGVAQRLSTALPQGLAEEYAGSNPASTTNYGGVVQRHQSSGIAVSNGQFKGEMPFPLRAGSNIEGIPDTSSKDHVGSTPTPAAIFHEQALAYAKEAPGTKVCLSGSLAQILKAQARCLELGLPHFLVVDSGCENFYGGEPIVTAFGLGPLYKHQAKPVVGKFRLHL